MSTSNTSIEQEEIKINKYDSTQLKHTVDDHIRKYLTTDAGYAENHQHMDVKLSLGYISCVFAIAATYYEWENGFERAKPVTLICVVSYFLLNFIAWVYAYFVEKQDVFVGTKDGSTLKISAHTERLSEIYTLNFYSSDSKSKKHGEHTLQSSFGKWFNEDGVLVASALEADVKTAIEQSTAFKEQ
ncbi:signal peptidase complex subunit 2 [Umbelopsis sp. PMI_123]|nr:signal peptidase complex subunit 2 [Umbelopsis sp. PMI_123]